MGPEVGETAPRLLKGIADDGVLSSYKEPLVFGGCPNRFAAGAAAARRGWIK